MNLLGARLVFNAHYFNTIGSNHSKLALHVHIGNRGRDSIGCMTGDFDQKAARAQQPPSSFL